MHCWCSFYMLFQSWFCYYYLRERMLLKAYLANFWNSTSKNTSCSSGTQKLNQLLKSFDFSQMQSYVFFRCTCKDKDSQQKVCHKTHLSLSLFNNANPCDNPGCSTSHMESHTFICKRYFANKVKHNMYLTGISSVSCGGGWKFHYSATVAT